MALGLSSSFVVDERTGVATHLVRMPVCGDGGKPRQPVRCDPRSKRDGGTGILADERDDASTLGPMRQGQDEGEKGLTKICARSPLFKRLRKVFEVLRKI